MQGIPQHAPLCMTPARQRRFWRCAPPEVLRDHQLARLNRLLATALAQQPFYQQKYRGLRLPLTSLDQLCELPLLEKHELIAGDGPAAICGLPASRYVRAHQTSGTTGEPLRLLDTREDWRWWLACWQYVLDAAEVRSSDVAFMAFSYGPFIGFWTAHDACIRRGVTVIPGGGMTSLARLKMIAASRPSVLCCTPTYALHLATVAEENGIDLAGSSVSRIIVAGEPGGSIPEVRRRIESLWGARLIDHCGATELGAWGVGNRDGSGVHVIESEFIAERLIFDAAAPQGRPAGEGELAELVLTGLGRCGAPAIRYRTGDLVRGRQSDDPHHRFLLLDGGIVGRADSMVVIRGVNVFPSSIEAIVRRVAGDAEYRVLRGTERSMEQLRVQLECDSSDPELAGRLGAAFQHRLGLRIEVTAVAKGALPRFEAKARRWVREEEVCS